MIKTAIKSLFAHKIRFILTAVAIVLGVSLVAGTFIFTDTINAQFDDLLDDIYAGIDVSVRADAGDFGASTEPFPAEVLGSVLAVDGVDVAEGGVASISIQVLDKSGDPIGGQGPPTLGFSWGEVPSLSPMRIKDGGGLPPSGPGEVMLDANTVDNAGFVLGDEVTVIGFLGPEEFELVGIGSFGDQDSLLGATLVLFELEEARRVFGFGDEFSGISVQAVADVDADELTERISLVLPSGVEAVTGETEQDEQAADINEGLSFLSIGLLSFAGVSVFVGAFIIQNTFRIVVAQRTRELALLRAIGATGRQIRVMVIVEALFIGLVGSVAGIAFGFVMALAIRGLMNAGGFGVPADALVLLPRTLVVSMLVGLGLTLLSSLLPARKASRIPPVAAMREDAARTPRRSLRTRAIAGTAITGLGVLLLAVGLFASVGRRLHRCICACTARCKTTCRRHRVAVTTPIRDLRSPRQGEHEAQAPSNCLDRVRVDGRRRPCRLLFGVRSLDEGLHLRYRLRALSRRPHIPVREPERSGAASSDQPGICRGSGDLR